MAKIQKRHIDQINRVWDDLMQEAYDALSYVDCDGKYNKTLERLDDRFERALENIINDANK